MTHTPAAATTTSKTQKQAHQSFHHTAILFRDQTKRFYPHIGQGMETQLSLGLGCLRDTVLSGYH